MISEVTIPSSFFSPLIGTNSRWLHLQRPDTYPCVWITALARRTPPSSHAPLFKSHPNLCLKKQKQKTFSYRGEKLQMSHLWFDMHRNSVIFNSSKVFVSVTWKLWICFFRNIDGGFGGGTLSPDTEVTGKKAIDREYSSLKHSLCMWYTDNSLRKVCAVQKLTQNMSEG